MAENVRVVLMLENIYSMIALLGLGLLGSAITFMAEILKKKWETHKKSSKGKSTKDIHTEKEVDSGQGAIFTLGIGPKEDGLTEIM